MNRLVAIGLLAVVSLLVVGESATADDVLSANVKKVRIDLVSPEPDAIIPQNNPSSGCALSLTRGYGLRIDFAWNTKHKKAVAEYRLVARLGASIPIVDVTIPGTSYTLVACDAFVQVQNLTGWVWSVSGLDENGNVIATTQASFSFAPCQLGDGTPCS